MAENVMVKPRTAVVWPADHAVTADVFAEPQIRHHLAVEPTVEFRSALAAVRRTSPFGCVVSTRIEVGACAQQGEQRDCGDQ